MFSAMVVAAIYEGCGAKISSETNTLEIVDNPKPITQIEDNPYGNINIEGVTGGEPASPIMNTENPEFIQMEGMKPGCEITPGNEIGPGGEYTPINVENPNGGVTPGGNRVLPNRYTYPVDENDPFATQMKIQYKPGSQSYRDIGEYEWIDFDKYREAGCPRLPNEEDIADYTAPPEFKIFDDEAMNRLHNLPDNEKMKLIKGPSA